MHPHDNTSAICEYCSKEFTYNRFSSKGRFCSSNCAQQSRNQPVTVTCQQCGNPFQTHQCFINNGAGKYCSRACSAIASRTPAPIADRLWAKVQKTETCWLWTGYAPGKGYGKIGIKVGEKWTMALAHRVSYELAYGPIPDGLFACHRCDTPACVRPDHLFLGTNDDNMQDKVTKGRQMKGAGAKAAKMTDELVTEIRQRYAAGGISKTTLAKEYGLGKPAMGDILNHVTWKHLS